MAQKVLITGGRNYDNLTFLFRMLDACHGKRGISMIIQGDAQGADALSKQWAKSRQLPYLSCPAEWNKLGKAAGMRRNVDMLAYEPDLVIAFAGGTGTAGMIREALKAGVEVIDLRERE